MHNLFDGCVLRLFIEPELNDPTLGQNHRDRLLREAIDGAADAMFELAWAYTSPGSLEDPRRPNATDAGTMFDRVVEAAVDLYQDADLVDLVDPVDPEKAATKAGAPTFSTLFPTPGDLADSVLRRLVSAGGFGSSGIENPAKVIKAALGRLAKVVTTHPRLIAAARDRPPTHPAGSPPFLTEVTEAIAGALQSPSAICAQPDRTAAELVELALEGDAGRAGLNATLNVIDANRGPGVTPGGVAAAGRSPQED